MEPIFAIDGMLIEIRKPSHAPSLPVTGQCAHSHIPHSRGVSPKQQTYTSTNKHNSHEDGGISDKQNNASLWPNWLPQVKGPVKQENAQREFSRYWVSCNGCSVLSFSLKQTFTMTDSHTLCPAIYCQETTQCLQAQVLKWFSFGNNVQFQSFLRKAGERIPTSCVCELWGHKLHNQPPDNRPTWSSSWASTVNHNPHPNKISNFAHIQYKPVTKHVSSPIWFRRKNQHKWPKPTGHPSNKYKSFTTPAAGSLT